MLFIRVQLICDVVPISTAQPSDPVTHAHTFHFLYDPPSRSIPRDWLSFPVLYVLLFLCPKTVFILSGSSISEFGKQIAVHLILVIQILPQKQILCKSGVLGAK